MTLAQDIKTGKAVAPRLYMFSAHDFNIGSLMEVANVKNENGIPEYGAVFSLELYRSRSSGFYSVLVSQDSTTHITIVCKKDLSLLT